MLIRWQLSAHVLTTLSFLCSTAWSRSAPRQIFDDDESRYAYGQSGDDGSVAGDTEPNGPYERLDMFSLLPTQDEVLQAIDSPEVNVAAESLNALNIPQYGNWTDGAWLLRFRGYIFTQPRVFHKTIEKYLNRILGFPAWTLREDQYQHAMQMARGLFIVLKPNVQLSWQLAHEDDRGPVADGNKQVWPPARNEVIAPDVTDFVGDYDFFTNVDGKLGGYATPGDSTIDIQVIQIRSNATSNFGISRSYLVPESGLTIVSDIDDILRESTIYHLSEGFQNLLTRPFYPWMNMPDIFGNWSRSLPNSHFHYLTTAPDQMAQSYMDFIYNTYPHGSYDSRAVNLRRFRSSWSIRSGLLEKILQTFPNRKFVLVGDNSNHDIMKNYPLLAQKYPSQVQCILVRNVSATDPKFRWPYTTEYFEPLDPESYMLFRSPDDLLNIDIEGGHCNNASVPPFSKFGWYGRRKQ